MTLRARRILPLLVLALAGGVVACLLLGREAPRTAEVVRHDASQPAPEARLHGPPYAVGPTTRSEAEGDTRDRPARWRLIFRVEGPDGAPNPFTKAWLVNEEGRVDRALVPEAGASGGELLVSGTCRLVVASDGLAPWSSDRLSPPETGRLELVARHGPGLPLAGVVCHADGETPFGPTSLTVECVPRVGAFMTAGVERQVEVTADGRFSLQGLPPGRVRISVRFTEVYAERVTTTVSDAGDEDVRVVVPRAPTCKLDVFVVDAEAGHAPQDTRVAAYVTVDERERLWARRHLGAREPPNGAGWLGTFEAPRASTLRFRLVALGYEQVEPHVLQVPDDAGPHRVQLALRPRPGQVGHLTIRILTSGHPTPSIVRGRYDHPSVSLELERKVVNDRVVLRLPPGRSRLTLESPSDRGAMEGVRGALVGDVEIEIGAGERREIELPLQLGGFVFLVGESNAWCPRFELARGNERISREASVREREGERGYWAARPVPPGSWSFTYDGKDVRWAGEVVVRGGAVTIVHRDQLEQVADLPQADER